MPCRPNESVDAAPSSPRCITPPPVKSNGGAGHAESDAEGTNAESDSDVEKKFAKSTGRGKWCRETTKPRKTIEKRKYAPFSEYREVGRWATGPDSTLEPREIDREIHVLMKKYMQDSRLMQTPAHDQLSTDKALWKQNRAEYHNSRTDEMIHMFDCPLKYRCKCKAKVRIITGRGYKRLEFSGIHDENSHADDKSKSLRYNQIVAIHDAVLVAPSQSAAVLRRNLMQAQGSPEQHKHMDPSQLRVIQRRVCSARQELVKQKLAAASVPETYGELVGWCEKQDFHAALKRHNDPDDEYCMPLFSAFVIGSDIKPERDAIHVNFSSAWFLANAIRALECGWVVQLNGDGTFGFCRADIDMLGLGFCSMGAANHPACWSYIPHKTEGELMYTVTFREMEKAALALLTANTEKPCEFSTFIGHLLSQPTVQGYLSSDEYEAGKLPIDQAQCDHQAGWRNFSLKELGKTPNICSNHLTGDILPFFVSRYTPQCLLSRRHCRGQYIASSIF